MLLHVQGAQDRGLVACAHNGAEAAGGCTEAVFLQNLQVYDLYTLRGFLSEVQNEFHASDSGPANLIQN